MSAPDTRKMPSSCFVPDGSRQHPRLTFFEPWQIPERERWHWRRCESYPPHFITLTGGRDCTLDWETLSRRLESCTGQSPSTTAPWSGSRWILPSRRCEATGGG